MTENFSVEVESSVQDVPWRTGAAHLEELHLRAFNESHPDSDKKDSSVEAACRRVEAKDPVLAARATTMPTTRILSEEKAEFVLALEDPMSFEIYSRIINNLELKFSAAKTLDEALAAVYSARVRGVPLMVLVDVLEWEPKLLEEHKKGKFPFVVRISIDDKRGPCDAVLAPSEPSVTLQHLHNSCIDLRRSQIEKAAPAVQTAAQTQITSIYV